MIYCLNSVEIFLIRFISESLRKNPIVGQLFKVCTENYTYTSAGPEFKNLSVTVEKDNTIVLPVAGLQKDVKFWRSPEEFIPERFLDKSDINKYCFLPFGEGPRTCLGEILNRFFWNIFCPKIISKRGIINMAFSFSGLRFAMTQIKLGVSQLIRSFELSVNSKTQLPLKYDKWFIMLCPLGGLWLDFKKINEGWKRE